MNFFRAQVPYQQEVHGQGIALLSKVTVNEGEICQSEGPFCAYKVNLTGFCSCYPCIPGTPWAKTIRRAYNYSVRIIYGFWPVHRVFRTCI